MATFEIMLKRSQKTFTVEDVPWWLGKLTSCCGESFCSTFVEADKGKPCAQCGSASFFKGKKTHTAAADESCNKDDLLGWR